MLTKILDLVKRHQYDIYLGTCFALVAIISFNLGKIGLFRQGAVNYSQNADIYKSISSNDQNEPKSSATPIDKRVVASKLSTSKKYHFTWCAGAKSIKEENKLWFATEADAVNAGYSLAGNCQ